MAKWVNSTVLDNGLNGIKNNATVERLVKAYTLNDSYATVVTNTIASAAVNTNSFTLSSNGSNRLLTAATASMVASAASGASPDLHVVFTDTSNVLWVTDETSNRVIAIGDTVNLPVAIISSVQPI